MFDQEAFQRGSVSARKTVVFGERDVAQVFDTPVIIEEKFFGSWHRGHGLSSSSKRQGVVGLFFDGLRQWIADISGTDFLETSGFAGEQDGIVVLVAGQGKA